MPKCVRQFSLDAMRFFEIYVNVAAPFVDHIILFVEAVEQCGDPF